MFKIATNPTFKYKVEIPRADGEPGAIVFEFRHKTTDELGDFLKRADKSKPRAWSKEIVVGWEGVDMAFSEDALALLMQNHFAAAQAILSGYLQGVSGGKLGN